MWKWIFNCSKVACSQKTFVFHENTTQNSTSFYKKRNRYFFFIRNTEKNKNFCKNGKNLSISIFDYNTKKVIELSLRKTKRQKTRGGRKKNFIFVLYRDDIEFFARNGNEVKGRCNVEIVCWWIRESDVIEFAPSARDRRFLDTYMFDNFDLLISQFRDGFFVKRWLFRRRWTLRDFFSILD